MNILVKFKNLVVESLMDNKKLIIILYVLFIACFIAAWVISADSMASVTGALNDSSSISNSTADMTGASPTDLFVHNAYGGIVTYLGSIFFGIFAVVSIIYNAFNLGLVGQLFNTMFPNGGMRYLVYVIPHGIFEITATVIQSAAGIMLFLFVWRFITQIIRSETHNVGDAFSKTKKVLIQSLVLMVFSMILLLIAAPIEAYFSVPFSEFIVGA